MLRGEPSLSTAVPPSSDQGESGVNSLEVKG